MWTVCTIFVATLATLVNKKQTNWVKLIDYCLMIYRKNVWYWLNDGPFYLLYGRDSVCHNLKFGIVRNQRIEKEDVDEY